MFVVRETFTAKPGMASKLATMFKSIESFGPRGAKVRILTDHIGPFNTVVFEMEVAELAEFDKAMAEYASNTELREKMKGYTEMYVTGRREVYKIV